METPEITELRGLVDQMSGELANLRPLIAQMKKDVQIFHDYVEPMPEKLNIIMRSLRKCQSRCHVDNPPGRWRGLGRAITAFFKSNDHQQLTAERTDVEQ